MRNRDHPEKKKGSGAEPKATQNALKAAEGRRNQHDRVPFPSSFFLFLSAAFSVF
jgi:hypothetical protein